MRARPVRAGERHGVWEVVRWDGRRRWYCVCTACGAVRWLLRQSLVYPDRRAVCRHATDADAAARAHLRRLRLKAYSVRRKLGRGAYADVRLHAPWAEDLDAFVEYMMTLDGWDDVRLSLDRVDPWGHYEPGNLRFATALEQARNKRRWRTQRAPDAADGGPISI